MMSDTMRLQGRTDRIALFLALTTFGTIGAVALALHVHFAETLFIKRVIAGIAGCL